MKTLAYKIGLYSALLMTGVLTSAAENLEDVVWSGGLRAAYFGDRPIIENDEVIALDAPKRAEDSAVVPIAISTHWPQTEERYIKTITLLIDKNPVPLAGRFHFTPKSGRADIATRIRVNEYSPVRAIAETNDGKLYMSRRFVKASGGCSAPIGSDLDAAMARLGKMKLTLREQSSPGQPQLAQLRVSHPNITGLQMDQVTRFYAPAHFVKQFEVTYAGEPILSAETDISISENPSLRFYFMPEQAGELRAQVIDSKDLSFTGSYQVTPN